MLAVSLLLTGLPLTSAAQDIPARPVPPRLVNDFAAMLDSRDVSYLENKLVAFSDSTSTQIAIVTVPSLNGYAISDFAQRLGEKWGIGQKGFDNGLLILLKPKTGQSRGEVFIAQGYGLEGVIPDLVCSDIVNNIILPAFRAGDYAGGLDRAVSTLMSLARGEFSADQYMASPKGSGKSDAGEISVFGLVVIILIIMAVFRGRSGGSNNRHISSGNLPLWLLLSMMNSGRGSHGGSWGGFSGGGRGGGGGFGGFGGGGFGGGGAGGSW